MTPLEADADTSVPTGKAILPHSPSCAFTALGRNT
jgi:hypothetical protein